MCGLPTAQCSNYQEQVSTFTHRHPVLSSCTSGSLPRVTRDTGYGPKSLIRWASHSGTWLGPTHPVSGDGPASKGYTYGPPN
jgi:hypothetical protein